MDLACPLTIGEFDKGWKAIKTRWEKEYKNMSQWFKREIKMWAGNITRKVL